MADEKSAGDYGVQIGLLLAGLLAGIAKGWHSTRKAVHVDSHARIDELENTVQELKRLLNQRNKIMDEAVAELAVQKMDIGSIKRQLVSNEIQAADRQHEVVQELESIGERISRLMRTLTMKEAGDSGRMV